MSIAQAAATRSGLASAAASLASAAASLACRPARSLETASRAGTNRGVPRRSDLSFSEGHGTRRCLRKLDSETLRLRPRRRLLRPSNSEGCTRLSRHAKRTRQVLDATVTVRTPGSQAAPNQRGSSAAPRLGSATGACNHRESADWRTH
jgi:hypothetical protein